MDEETKAALALVARHYGLTEADADKWLGKGRDHVEKRRKNGSKGGRPPAEDIDLDQLQARQWFSIYHENGGETPPQTKAEVIAEVATHVDPVLAEAANQLRAAGLGAKKKKFRELKARLRARWDRDKARQKNNTPEPDPEDAGAPEDTYWPEIFGSRSEKADS